MNIGAPYPATIIEVTDTTVTFDTNHPLAGETLNFEVELMELKRIEVCTDSAQPSLPPTRARACGGLPCEVCDLAY